MRFAGVVALGMGLLAGCLRMRAAPVINPAEYGARRESLRRGLNTLLVVFGRKSNSEQELRSGFLQDSYFYYLTGWTQPDAAILLTKNEEEMFLPPRNEVYERYYGHKTSATDADAKEATGFQKLFANTELERELFRLLAENKTIDVIEPQPQSMLVQQLLALRPAVKVENAAKQIDTLRAIKSVTEIAAIQRSADVSVAAQSHAFHLARPGKFEYQLAADMQQKWLDAGCEGPAYEPIVASGPNAIVLHYSANRRQFQPGDLVIIDAAAECGYYAADITRTIPVGGRFTKRQREVYDVVLAAQQSAIDKVKPGMLIGKKDTKGSLMEIAYNYINDHGKDAQGQPLGKHVLHGLSHHIGIDVHDPGDIMEPLKPGMVISIEPGVYIRDENLGVRIEDMVLVTNDGHRVLTSALPKTADAIEMLVRH